MGYYDGMGQWIEDENYSDGSRAGNTSPTWINPVQDRAPFSASPHGSWTPSEPAPAEYWIPPTASFGTDPSGQINRQNPWADPGRPFVNEGTTGGYQAGVGVTAGAGTSLQPGEYERRRAEALAAGVPAAWLTDFENRNRNAETGFGDAHRAREAWRSQQAGHTDGGPGSNGAPGGRGPLQSPQFSGAGQNLIENYATDRFGHLTNPDPNSGTALFEKYARELIDTLKGPVYSAQDESIIKGSAMDTIERDRTATKQRWLEEVGRRGFNPSSGVALAGIQRIEDQFNQYRTTVEAEFARKAIDQTRLQRQQVLGTAGQLAASEEGRLDKAGTYAYMPYGLEQDAFNRNLALVGAGGTPQSTLSSALALLNANMNANAYESAQQTALTQGLLEWLGYQFGRRG